MAQRILTEVYDTMSGPKSSYYYLSAAQRAALLEQERLRREHEAEQLKCKQLQQEIEDIGRKADKRIGNISLLDERVRKLKRESGKSFSDIEQIYTRRNKLSRELRGLTASIKGKSSAQLSAIKDQVRKLCRDAESLCNEAAKAVETGYAQYQNELETVIQNGYQLSFAGLSRKTAVKSPQIEKIAAMMSEIGNLTLSEELESHLQTLREKASQVTDEAMLHNFSSVVVEPFVKRCKEYDALREEHDELLVRYAVLCSECGVEPKPFAYEKAALEALKEETLRLEQYANEQAEKAHIAAVLDETMREMGYELVGGRNVVKKSGKQIRHKLFQMEKGVAVDVTYTGDGQISMELGGLDAADRTPTAAESDELVGEMHSFCGRYNELQKRLSEQGITMEHISLLPPSGAYAQIFNINDYELTADVGRLEIRKATAETAKARFTED